MHIEEDEASDLKSWVVKRLEAIAVDADSDVLADYVLALIRTDTPETQLRADVLENLQDFLKENTSAFVNTVFLAIQGGTYKPGYKPPPAHTPFATSNSSSFPAPTQQPSAYGTSRGGSQQQQQQPSGLPESRKRSYNDSHGNGPGNSDPQYSHRGDRQIKQARRGGRGGHGRGGFDGRGGGFQQNGFPGHGNTGSPSSVPQGFPTMPNFPQGMGFDTHDPMAAIMAMQAMGLPPLPGMPGFPGAGGSPNGLAQRLPSMNGGKLKQRCRDYDNKGYCTRGDACPYLHGTDRVVVPGQQDEYDPNDAVMPTANPPYFTPDGDGSFTMPTGGRGRGDRGRGDRGRGRGHGHGDNAQGAGFRKPKRASFSHSGPNHDRAITTIVVEQIPEEQFNEPSVVEFFSEFGTIEEVTMQPYKRLALVRFSDYFAARAAYDSPKVIFDNRFVKVYWYKPGSVPTPIQGGRPGAALSSTSNPDAKEEPPEPEFDAEAFAATSALAQQKLDAKKAAIAAMNEKREALEKQKADLAAKQSAEKQKLLDRLAAKGASLSKDNDTMMGEGMHDPANGSTFTKSNDDEEPRKESAHTALLRAKLAEVEATARALGLDAALSDAPSTSTAWTARGRGRGSRGRGSYRGWESFDPSYRGGRGRGSAFHAASRGGSGRYNLDNRPKRVSVTLSPGSEWTADKDEGLRLFLMGIGEFEDIQPLPQQPQVQIVSFKDRATAEGFFFGAKGKDELSGIGKVDIAWYSTPVAAPAAGDETTGNGANGGIADGENGGVSHDHAMEEVANGRAEESTGTAATAATTTTTSTATAAIDGGHGAAEAKPADVDYDVAEEDDDDEWMDRS